MCNVPYSCTSNKDQDILNKGKCTEILSLKGCREVDHRSQIITESLFYPPECIVSNYKQLLLMFLQYFLVSKTSYA